MTQPRNNKSDESFSSSVFYTQLSVSVKELTAASYRLEEKIKALHDQQIQLAQRFEKLLDNYNNLLERVITVEAQDVENVNDTLDDLNGKVSIIRKSISDMEKTISLNERSDKDFSDRITKLERQNEHLKIFKEGTEDKFKKFTSLALQIIYNVVLMYIAYKIGISSPGN
jgi:chromosome segregation ATPase